MSRIKILASAVLATTLTAGLSTSALAAAGDPVKIGLMLPFSGIYAQLSEAGRDGLKLALKENTSELHGSPVEFSELDICQTTLKFAKTRRHFRTFSDPPDFKM